jgi:DUF1365 family protein
MTAAGNVALAFGVIRHVRLHPAHHAFAYPCFFLRLRMDGLPQQGDLPAGFGLNRRGLISFHDRDHGAGDGHSLAWVRGLLAEGGIDDADGPIWLHTFARVLGYAFKPVSFWYCHRADGRLRAIVCEVNNTFGERHAYLLAHRNQPLRNGEDLTAAKSFFVSPFFRVEGEYRFRFMNPPGRTVARIDYHDGDTALLNTSMSGIYAPLDARAMLRALFGYPMFTFGVIVRIHYHALRLWLKRVPLVSKPASPAAAGGPGQALRNPTEH